MPQSLWCCVASCGCLNSCDLGHLECCGPPFTRQLIEQLALHLLNSGITSALRTELDAATLDKQQTEAELTAMQAHYDSTWTPAIDFSTVPIDDVVKTRFPSFFRDR